MSGSKVSVIVTSYNFKGFITEALESVLGQTYSNLEAVVCDDGSTDGTPEIIRQFASRDPRVVALLSEKNKGLSANINGALDRCTGDYVVFMSGDDVMLPEKVQRQVEFLESHAEAAMVLHPMEIFEHQTGRVRERQNSAHILTDPETWFFNINWLLKTETRVFPSPSLMARASYVLKNRFDSRLKYKNEVLFFLDAYQQNPNACWGVVPQILARYRVHDRNMHSSRAMNEELFDETRVLYEIIAGRYPSLEKKAREARDFFNFRGLLYDFFPKDRKAEIERRFLADAGLLKWLYLGVCRFLLSRKRLLEWTRPLRKNVRQWSEKAAA